MSIKVHCPNGHRFRVNDKHAGRVGACPQCSASVKVPLSNQDDGGLGGSGAFHRPSVEPVQQAQRYGRAETDLDSSLSSLSSPSLISGKEKLCVACGKIVSQSFSTCTRCGTPVSAFRHLALRKNGSVVIIQFRQSQITEPSTVAAVAEELCSVASRAKDCDLVLDLSKMACLSSLMLGKLVMVQRKMEGRGGMLRLCNGGPEIRDVLASTRLDEILPVEDDKMDDAESVV